MSILTGAGLDDAQRESFVMNTALVVQRWSRIHARRRGLLQGLQVQAAVHRITAHGHGGGHGVEVRVLVVLVGQIAVHDQAEYRGLHPADRQHALHALGRRGEAIGAGHVEAVELVGNAARAATLGQPVEVAVVA
ncbi:hypothetical protein FQZ97_467980 [compost metagenome]